MQVSSSHVAARGHLVYAQAAARQRIENAAQEQTERQAQKSSVGFSVGKFGVRYETEEQAVAEESLASAQSDVLQQSAQQDPLADLKLLGQRRHGALSANDESGQSGINKRFAANAYARSESDYQSQQESGMLKMVV